MRRRIYQRLLLAANFLLAALLAYSFTGNPYTIVHGSNSNFAQSAEPWQPARLPQRKPLSYYQQALRGRSVFGYGVVEEPIARQRSIIEDFQFIGASRSPSGQRGFLRNTVSGRTRTVAVGDMIGDYRVQEIQPGGVRLDKGGETFELKR